MFCKLDEDNAPRSVQTYATRLREDVQNARAAIAAAQERQAKYANQHRRDGIFKVGYKVWLSASHLRLPRAQNARRKLQPRWYGPYRIAEVISQVAYRLELPATFKIHPVIHISRLKANLDGSQDFPNRPAYVPPPPPEILDDEEFYSIEAFRNHRGKANTLKFLVKWTGYGEDENKWISARQLQADMTAETYKELLDAYQLQTKAKL